jgi:hypothetical protein
MTMTNDDLERALRTEPGPREEGYLPTPLPISLDAVPTAARPTRLPRAALLAGAALAGALAVAVVAAILAGPGASPSPGVGSGGSATPSASASSPSNRCTILDITFSAEPWGGAAGSRGTMVTISSIDGRYACALAPSVAAQIADANGAVLVEGAATSSGPPVVVRPGTAFAVGVAWSNWCGADPAGPVRLSLQPEGWPSPVPVTVPAGGNPVPPCLGSGEPSTLSVTEVQPAP